MNLSFIDFLSNYCTTIQGCLQGIYNLLVALSVFVAFVVFIFGAFKNLLSTVPDVKAEGKNQMKNAIIGLIVIFSSGVLLYWVNPEIFNAKLIMFRVDFTGPKVTGKEMLVTEEGIPISFTTAPAPRLNPGEAKTFTGVRVTRYYTPIESQKEFRYKNFLSEVKVQGSGKCEGGGYCRCDICSSYNGYINYQYNKTKAPLDACGYIAIPGRTFAVPPEWHPSLIEVYYNGRLYASGYGTDRGSAIKGLHIDHYVGEGDESFKNYANIDSATVKVQKLNGCKNKILKDVLQKP